MQLSQSPKNLNHPNSASSNFSNSKWLAILLLIFGLGLLGLVDALLIIPLKDLTVANSGNDFSVFWAGAQTVLKGSNPYLTTPGSTFREIMLANGSNLQPLEPYISPHYLTLFFVPLALLPLGLAATIWTLISQILMAIAIILIIRVIRGKLTPPDLLLGLGIAMLWRYTFLVMLVGNISLALLGVVVAAFYCNRTGRPLLGGGLAAILLVKPQVVFLIVPLLLVMPSSLKAGEPASWLNRATYRRWAGFGAVSGLLAVYSFSLLPNWIGEWLKGVAATGYSDDPTLGAQVTSLRSVATALVSNQTLVLPVTLLLGLPFWVAILWLWWSHRRDVGSQPYLLSAAAVTSVLTTPYIRDYDSCLLLFPLLVGFFALRQVEAQIPPKKGLRLSWLGWGIAFLPYPLHLLAGQANFSYTLEPLIPLLLLGFSLWVWRIAAENGLIAGHSRAKSGKEVTA